MDVQFIFHVKRDKNCSLCVRRLGMGPALKPPYQAGYKFDKFLADSDSDPEPIT